MDASGNSTDTPCHTRLSPLLRAAKTSFTSSASKHGSHRAFLYFNLQGSIKTKQNTAFDTTRFSFKLSTSSWLTRRQTKKLLFKASILQNDQITLLQNRGAFSALNRERKGFPESPLAPHAAPQPGRPRFPWPAENRDSARHR